MLHIAGAGISVFDVKIRIDDRLKFLYQLIEGCLCPAPYIERLTGNILGLACQEVGLNHIGHERKIPGLFTISVYDERFLC